MTLPRVRRGDDDRRADPPFLAVVPDGDLFQVLQVSDRHLLAVRGELRLQAGPLHIHNVVPSDIPCDLLDALLSLADLLVTAHLALEVGLLLLRQPGGLTLKPAVDLLLRHIEVDDTPLVQQLHDRLVLDGWRLVYLSMQPPNFAADFFSLRVSVVPVKPMSLALL